MGQHGDHRVSRYAVVDAFRGVAIWLMFVYHFSWDLTYFGFADFQVTTDPAWIWFARIIAGTILLVMGISQAIAAERDFVRATFLKRLTIIVACAAGISAATYMVDPNSFIFFGILHHITIASILMLAIIRMQTQNLVILAGVCLLMPLFFTHEIFFAPWLWWVGLSPVSPPTIDYVPLLPWLGISIIGVLIGRTWFTGREPGALAAWKPSSLLSKLIHGAGKHSLLLYMIHQPILFGGCYGIYWILNS
jgi:uncharacterized membrane protein